MASKKSKITKIIIATAITAIISAVALFVASHSTYYKYNDWWIVENSIENVRSKYGEFDRGRYGNYNCDGNFGTKGGTVGYFLYEDNSMVMPSHLPYYYWVQYNSDGIVEKVFVDTLPGG